MRLTLVYRIDLEHFQTAIWRARASARSRCIASVRVCILNCSWNMKIETNLKTIEKSNISRMRAHSSARTHTHTHTTRERAPNNQQLNVLEWEWTENAALTPKPRKRAYLSVWFRLSFLFLLLVRLLFSFSFPIQLMCSGECMLFFCIYVYIFFAFLSWFCYFSFFFSLLLFFLAQCIEQIVCRYNFTLWPCNHTLLLSYAMFRIGALIIIAVSFCWLFCHLRASLSVHIMLSSSFLPYFANCEFIQYIYIGFVVAIHICIAHTVAFVWRTEREREKVR